MRLTDLNPRWIGLNGWSSPSPFYIGVRFDCPHCGRKLAARFRVPIDPGNIAATFLAPYVPPEPAWEREGDTFETLTLSPSIDVSQFGHWHGFIKNGEVQ